MRRHTQRDVEDKTRIERVCPVTSDNSHRLPRVLTALAEGGPRAFLREVPAPLLAAVQHLPLLRRSVGEVREERPAQIPEECYEAAQGQQLVLVVGFHRPAGPRDHRVPGPQEPLQPQLLVRPHRPHLRPYEEVGGVFAAGHVHLLEVEFEEPPSPTARHVRQRSPVHLQVHLPGVGEGKTSCMAEPLLAHPIPRLFPRAPKLPASNAGRA
mmetsp:Transcript_93090/g.221394  ORF Transcript_93090/g.221394 Transcript_93090/m.221394 type:complete len:211 (+) Transcript_93090:756-1388(+)